MTHARRRERVLACLFAIGALIAAACGGDGDDPTPSPASSPPAATATETGAPAETPPPSPAPTEPAGTPTGPPAAAFEEAFPGLPRLDRPLAMSEVGPGTLLIALQDGRVLAIAKDGPYDQPALALDWRDRTSRDGNEEGLLSIAADPAFRENGFLYVYYNAEAGSRRTVLSRFATSGSGTGFAIDPSSELVVLEFPQPFSNHNGGTIAFGPDGMLYLGLGDGGAGGDPENNGQDLEENLLGGIIRIDVGGASEDEPYRVPDDNPFADAGDVRPETWAYGLRNPWRMSFDRETGTLWAGDVGQNRIEEVDIVERGANYGWNVMEGSSCFEARGRLGD